jgi:hypothetical protein
VFFLYNSSNNIFLVSWKKTVVFFLYIKGAADDAIFRNRFHQCYHLHIITLQQICIHPKLPLVTHRGPHDVSGWDQLALNRCSHTCWAAGSTMSTCGGWGVEVTTDGHGSIVLSPRVRVGSVSAVRRPVYSLPSHRQVSTGGWSVLLAQFSFIRVETNLRPNYMSPIWV